MGAKGIDRGKKNVDRARWSLRTTGIYVFLFSAAVNILMLTGPLFMLQVYDRVLTSRSVPTLVGLFGLVALLYAFMALFDFVRNRILSRAAHRLDLDLAPYAQRAHILAGAGQVPKRGRPEGDLSQVRQFLGSGAVGAFFDLPWVPIYIIIVFLLHPWLGWLAIAGAGLVVVLTVINFWTTGRVMRAASGYEQRNSTLAEEARGNAEAIVSLGMVSRIAERWSRTRQTGMAHTQKAASVSEWLTAFTKSFRMLMQSGVLALGAWLVIRGEITAGTMIAASILVGRALAPVDQSIAQWRNATRARQAWGRLASMLAVTPPEAERTELPAPKGNLQVAGLGQLARAPNGQPDSSIRPILGGIDFALEPGDGLGILGPSASGKSSLAKLLVGLWTPDRGTVRLDGAT
ncbi:MAG: ABC transporter transmembrane domain-containing protein, partial [Pseudomonadota bacterium]